MKLIKNNLNLCLVVLLIFLFSTGCGVINKFTATSNNANANTSSNNSKGETPDVNTGKVTPQICQNAYYPVGENIEQYRV